MWTGFRRHCGPPRGEQDKRRGRAPTVDGGALKEMIAEILKTRIVPRASDECMRVRARARMSVCVCVRVL